MYEMYRWNQQTGPQDSTAPVPARGRRAGAGRPDRPGEAARAVQEALDRRDNGGDSAARRDR